MISWDLCKENEQTQLYFMLTLWPWPMVTATENGPLSRGKCSLEPWQIRQTWFKSIRVLFNVKIKQWTKRHHLYAQHCYHAKFAQLLTLYTVWHFSRDGNGMLLTWITKVYLQLTTIKYSRPKSLNVSPVQKQNKTWNCYDHRLPGFQHTHTHAPVHMQALRSGLFFTSIMR